MTTDHHPTSVQISKVTLPASTSKNSETASRTWALIDEQISENEFAQLSKDLKEWPEAREVYLDAMSLHFDLQEIFDNRKEDNRKEDKGKEDERGKTQ